MGSIEGSGETSLPEFDCKRRRVMDGEQDEQHVEREQSENSVAVESIFEGNWLRTLS